MRDTSKTASIDTGIKNIPVVQPAPPASCMEPDPLPTVLEVSPEPLLAQLAPEPVRKQEPKLERPLNRRENVLRTAIAWMARFAVGVILCCNVFPVSFITSIAVFGWLQRRMQALILRGWWRESPRQVEGTFQSFCDSLGENAPVLRPRWFVREHLLQHLHRTWKGGTGTDVLSMLWTLFTAPFHSLLLNFKTGIKGLFTTYLLTGWGCSIMLFSWYFGWVNSFHKGYEDAFLGLSSGLFGSFLLILALVYVPMAQAHQAASDDIAAFFQFRIIVTLILSRLTAYTMLLATLAFLSLLFEIPRVATLNDSLAMNSEDISPEEAFWLVEQYWLVCTVFFLFSLFVLRTLTAFIYRSAMLKSVRAGTILTSELPAQLALWFERLDIFPQAQIPRPKFFTFVRNSIGVKYRMFLLGFVFLFLFLFVLRFYVGYFLVFNEYRGILNHPFVQVPCIDWTPWHLVLHRNE